MKSQVEIKTEVDMNRFLLLINRLKELKEEFAAKPSFIKTIIELWKRIVAYRPKRVRIVGIEFVDAKGITHHKFLNQKHHIDDHEGICKADMHCTIAAIKRIKIKKDKVILLFEGGHKLIYSQISVRATYLKKA